MIQLLMRGGLRILGKTCLREEDEAQVACWFLGSSLTCQGEGRSPGKRWEKAETLVSFI